MEPNWSTNISFPGPPANVSRLYLFLLFLISGLAKIYRYSVPPSCVNVLLKLRCGQILQISANFSPLRTVYKRVKYITFSVCNAYILRRCGRIQKRERFSLVFIDPHRFSLLRKRCYFRLHSSPRPPSSSHPFLKLAPYFLAQRTNHSQIPHAVRGRRLIYARLEDFRA